MCKIEFSSDGRLQHTGCAPITRKTTMVSSVFISVRPKEAILSIFFVLSGWCIRTRAYIESEIVIKENDNKLQERIDKQAWFVTQANQKRLVDIGDHGSKCPRIYESKRLLYDHHNSNGYESKYDRVTIVVPHDRRVLKSRKTGGTIPSVIICPLIQSSDLRDQFTRTTTNLTMWKNKSWSMN